MSFFVADGCHGITNERTPVKLAFALLIGFAACAASAQSTNAPPAATDQAFESEVARRARHNPPIVREAKPNEIIGPRVSYEGIFVEAAKRRNLLQLINPWAPAEYGSAMDNAMRDPVAGRVMGLKFFSVKF